MTLTLSGLIILVVIAALCGAIGRSIAGGTHGGDARRGGTPRNA